MSEKIGRNDPCPCGSGKKYKNCCLTKETSKYSQGKRKFSATWVNAPAAPNLIERTFGAQINSREGFLFKPSIKGKTSGKDEGTETPSTHLDNPLHPQDK